MELPFKFDLQKGPELFEDTFGSIWGPRVWRAFFSVLIVGIAAVAGSQVIGLYRSVWPINAPPELCQTVRCVPPDKRPKFLSDLRGTTGRVYIVSDATVPDHDAFIADLMNLFTDSGWQAEKDVYYSERDNKRGIGVFSKDKTAAKAQIAAVLRAFADAGFSAFEYDDAKLKDARPDFPWGKGYDVGIRIFDRH
jgi:hypothetical protein